MERPPSIIWFERCYLGSLAVGLISTAFVWNDAMAQMAAQPSTSALGPTFIAATVFVGVAISVGISLLLWFLIARKRSVISKWIVTVFFVLGILNLLFEVVTRSFPTGFGAVVVIVAWVLDTIAVYHLFKPDAEIWFGENKAGPVA